MNVRCPNCQSAFRVDPERIPVSGIKARCSRCSSVFHLSRDGIQRAQTPTPSGPASTASAESPAAPVAAPREAGAPAPPPPSPPAVQATPAPPPVSASQRPAMATPVAAPLAPRPAAAASAPAIRPIPTGPPPVSVAQAQSTPQSTPPAPVVKRASFRNQDPGARAQRLARALVSDIVAYNKDKLKQTTANGAAALRTEFREEIRKSWEEYVEQVGLDLAKSSPYFRDALNEILAKGEKVF